MVPKPGMIICQFITAPLKNVCLKSRGVTMLLVEQFAAAALKVADYGYVLGRIVNFVPWPSSLCTSIEPPCATTTRRAVANPSPLPSGFVV